MSTLPEVGGSWTGPLQKEFMVLKKRKFTPTILILWVLLFANGLWLLDYLMRSRWTPTNIEGLSDIAFKKNEAYEQGNSGSIRLYFPGHEVLVDKSETTLIPESGRIEYRITPMFGIVAGIRVQDDSGWVEFSSILNLYYPFFFFPLLSGLAALVGLLIIKWLPHEELLEFKFGVLSLIFYLLSLLVYHVC